MWYINTIPASYNACNSVLEVYTILVVYNCLCCDKCIGMHIYLKVGHVIISPLTVRAAIRQFGLITSCSTDWTITVYHKALAGENFGGFGGLLPIRQSFIRQKAAKSREL